MWGNSVSEAFVYCWTDKLKDMLYVGYHKGDTDDGYICSSKYMLEEYAKRPQYFSRQIIATGTMDDMVALETAILKSDNAAVNERYYNRHVAGKFYNSYVSEETKKKISESKTGMKRPDVVKSNYENNPMKDAKVVNKMVEVRRKNGSYISGELNPRFGMKHTKETLIKMYQNRKGKGTMPKSEATKKKMSDARKLYWAKKRGEI